MHIKGSLGGLAALSPREFEVVRLAADGRTDQSICRHLAIAPGTLGTYWVRIRTKTGLSSRAELSAAYARLRLERLLARTVALIVEHTSASETRLFDALPMPCFVVQTNGTLILFNRMALHVLGPLLESRSDSGNRFAIQSAPHFSQLLQMAGDCDGEVRGTVENHTGLGARLCHLVARRVPSDSSTVVVLVSEQFAPSAQPEPS